MMKVDGASGDALRHQRMQELSPAKRAYLARLLGRTGAAEGLQVARRPAPGAPRPCPYAQRRPWFLARLARGPAAYTTLTTLRLEGAIDVAALAASLTAIVGRHEVLRTTFVEGDGQPYQV